MYIYSGLGQLPKSIGNIITYNDYKVMDPIIKHNLGNRIWPSILLPRLCIITCVMIYNQGYETNYYNVWMSMINFFDE